MPINNRNELVVRPDDMDDRIGREAYESPEQRLKSLVIRFGEAVSPGSLERATEKLIVA